MAAHSAAAAEERDMRVPGLQGRWFAISVALVVAILGVGCGGTSANEAGDSAVADEAAPVVAAGDDSVRDQSRPQGHADLAWLTAREAEVVLAIADGSTTTEVAQTLGITTRTVESHLLNAFRKLGVHSRVQLVRLLARAGHLRL
jgi:DNA-binding CsgD family transcriptional regulator